MEHIPSRPTGEDEEAFAMMAIWDRLWNPGESIFITAEGSPVQFEKQPNGKYIVRAKRSAAAPALREISICIDGDSTWFAQVAMTKPYKKDEDGKAYYPDPYPPGV